MRFYYIKDDYISFLRMYDTKVAENKNESRPYVGVVCEIEGIQYFAPLTSPKPKHLNMKNGKDFRKIKEGQYGAINFSNMIPVPIAALISFNIVQIADVKYRRLLQNQYNEIRKDQTMIEKTACNLRKLVFTDDSQLSPYDRIIKQRCCDFQSLEEVFENYGK